MQTAIPCQALGPGRRTLEGHAGDKEKNASGITGNGQLAQVARDLGDMSVNTSPCSTELLTVGYMDSEAKEDRDHG